MEEFHESQEEKITAINNIKKKNVLNRKGARGAEM